MKTSNLLRFSISGLSLTLAALSAFAGEMAPPTPTPPPPANLVTLSTRVVCGTGEAVAVTEFVIQGEGSKEVLLRGLGPSLHQNGVPHALRDPTLALLDADGAVLSYNDNWVDSPDREAISATGLAPSNGREPVILTELTPGFYTSVMRGSGNRTGIGVIEAYDLQAPNMQLYLAGAGTRGKVLQGDGVLISSVTIAGPAPLTVLVRTLGPSLTQAGLPGALADPYLRLVNADGVTVGENDNWMDSPYKDQISATGLAPSDDREPAILTSLFPYSYVAIASGVDGGTGLAFTQFYALTYPAWELDPAPQIRGR